MTDGVETVYVVDRVAAKPEKCHLFKSCGAITKSVRGAVERPRDEVDDLDVCDSCIARKQRLKKQGGGRSGLAQKLAETNPEDVGLSSLDETSDLITDGGEEVGRGTSHGGEVVWKYAIDHAQSFDTRHEAVGKAAVINRQRDDRRRDVVVWAYPECDCEDAVVTLDHGDACGRCGAVIA